MMGYPVQTLVVQKPGKKKKPGPLDAPVRLVNPDGTPFTAGGDSAITSVQVTVDDNTGTPSCTGSVADGVLTLAFKNLKGTAGAAGAKGDKGDKGDPGPAGADGTSFTKCAAVPNVSGDDATAAIATVNALLASLRAGGVLNAS